MQSYNLAIETSGHTGSITLGCNDNIVTTTQLKQRYRHTIELMPAIDEICKHRNIKPNQITELYVALGPGSFTGLRVAITTAKILALVNLDLKIIGIPSLNIVAQNTPQEFDNCTVCLNLKRNTIHSAIFKRSQDNTMNQTSEAKLRTLDELLKIAPRPLALIGEPLPEQISNLTDNLITCLTKETAQGKSEALWKLGRKRAKENKFDNPSTLTPLYIRQPEAVTLWNEKNKK